MTKPTPAEVRAEPPGPRLDAWFAEVVLGIEVEYVRLLDHYVGRVTVEGCLTKTWDRGLPQWSTDRDNLGAVLEELDRRGMVGDVRFSRVIDTGEVAFMGTIAVGNPRHHGPWCQTRSEAVVKAALLAALGEE